MSELLDAFDDAGLLDRETREFLVEALENAEADDWRDILEPFVSPPEPALEALQTVPGVLARSRKALAKVEQQKEEEVSPLADMFLKALAGGMIAIFGLHSAARISQVCRLSRTVAAEGELWRRRTERAAARWRLPRPPLPAGSEATWRDKYFSVLRPRCDGVYISECGFRRWIRLGHHMDLRKNAEALAFKASRGGSGEWVGYRRYVRLLPPEADGTAWAFVLTDPCPRAAAERVLVAGVDVRAHANPEKSEGSLQEGAAPSVSDPLRLKKRICLGRYTFAPDQGRIDIWYTATDGVFRLSLSLAHGGERRWADLLTWENYDMTESVEGEAEVVTFDLGRLPDWKGGGLADETKDHFPQMKFRPHVALEHLV